LIYRFDDFTLEPATRRLRHGDEDIHLSPKAFDLLLLLVQGRSRAISKDDLHQQLWPSTFVVESNLASLIAEIRRGLRDSAEQPRHVKTIHRFGYWFIGDVVELSPAEKRSRSPIRYWLVWDTRQIALADGDNIVGRAPDAAVWIDAPGVSRHHARIRLEGAQATVEDLGSKNGTYLGGERLTAPLPLADGDQIRLGSIVVTFRIPPPPETTDTVHES
jgi:DNA-binding winged helix-turn-helix (wHTH) protein